jgi:hypothetical protein
MDRRLDLYRRSLTPSIITFHCPTGTLSAGFIHSGACRANRCSVNQYHSTRTGSKPDRSSTPKLWPWYNPSTLSSHTHLQCRPHLLNPCCCLAAGTCSGLADFRLPRQSSCCLPGQTTVVVSGFDTELQHYYLTWTTGTAGLFRQVLHFLF